MDDIKKEIVGQILASLASQISTAERGLRDATIEFKAHKGAMESRYDTFKEEAEYLAGGFGRQVETLSKSVHELQNLLVNPPKIDRCSVYAFVEVEDQDDGSRLKFFFLPTGGGHTYEASEGKIIVVNIGAPIARALIGATAYDTVEAKIGGTTRSFRVISVK